MAKTSGNISGLNDRQTRFVFEYMKDFNGKSAAIRAGYSARSAEMQASRLISNDKVLMAIKEAQKILKERDESASDKIRRRLWEESEDKSEFATHSGRIRALELLGKIYGEFEADNAQSKPVVNIGRIELAALTDGKDTDGAD